MRGLVGVVGGTAGRQEVDDSISFMFYFYARVWVGGTSCWAHPHDAHPIPSHPIPPAPHSLILAAVVHYDNLICEVGPLPVAPALQVPARRMQRASDVQQAKCAGLVLQAGRARGRCATGQVCNRCAIVQQVCIRPGVRQVCDRQRCGRQVG